MGLPGGVSETIFGEFRNYGISYRLIIEGKNMGREEKITMTMGPFRELEAKMGKTKTTPPSVSSMTPAFIISERVMTIGCKNIAREMGVKNK